MRCLVLAFVAGTSVLQSQAELPDPAILVLMFLLALLCWVTSMLKRFRALKFCCLACAGFLTGFAWAAAFAHLYLQVELPNALEGKDLSIVGTIASLPARSAEALRFNFAVESVETSPGAVPVALSGFPARLALSWYGQSDQNGLPPFAAKPLPQPGERWLLKVRLRRPHGTANPYGFDYEAWLLEQNLRATGSVRTDGAAQSGNRRLDEFVFSVGNLVERLRAGLRDRMLRDLAGKPYAGVLVALVVGDQRDISPQDWKIFTRSGIGHLVSISGLHITMVAGLFASLLLALWRRSFFTALELPLLLPAQKAAALGGALAALGYVALSGFGVPAQRTLVMLAVVAYASWTGRIASISHVLCAALALVLLFDPWAVLWPGFWLSFGAVAVIVYATAGRVTVGAGGSHFSAGNGAGFDAGTGSRSHASTGPGSGPDSGPDHDFISSPGAAPARVWSTAIESPGAYFSSRAAGVRTMLATASLSQYAVTLGMVPFSLLLFGQFSLVSPLANAIAIPLVSFVVTPLALMGSLLPAPVSTFVLGLAHVLLELLVELLAWLCSFPAAVWQAPMPGWPVFLLALAGCAWMLAPRGWPQRWLGLLLWLPLVFQQPTSPRGPGQLHVTAFDVGQGMAVLLETAHHRLLYDTGPLYSTQSDGGSRVILPYLRARGISALDMLVISHSDADHSGGALSILDEIAITQVSSSLLARSAIVRSVADHRTCLAGQRWNWDGVLFEMLYPDQASLSDPGLAPNGRSCTLKVSAGKDAILLAGDIEAPQEQWLLTHARAQLPSTVLLAPHHGSGTSSTAPFLHAVSPQLALFQVGYRNRYRHPQAAVFERYAEFGIQRLRSDTSGAISLEMEQGTRHAEYRKTAARYWFNR